MPNQLTAAGLQIATVTEIVSSLVAGLQAIYGTDINIESNSPDGQKVNLFAQACIDQLELLMAVFASFDPDSVTGILADKRFALNGITRIAGTYTYTPVLVTVDRNVNLIGLDTDPTGATVFKASDGVNQYYLVNSATFTTGSTSASFRAVDLGAVLVSLNTITIISTVTLGVTAINNPVAATSLGTDEETDVQFKIRRIRSFYLPAVGPADAVLAAILNVSGVTDAYVYENATDSPAGSVPANSLWCIVEGGTDADVAQAIYTKKAPGCGLYGTGASVVITRTQGNSITITFDRTLTENLYVHFYLTPRIAGTIFDETYIKNTLSYTLQYKLAQMAETNSIISALNIIEPEAIITGCEVSTNNTDWYEVKDTTSAQYKFVLLSANITVLT